MEGNKNFGKPETSAIQVNEGELKKTRFGNRSGERGRHLERTVGS